MPKIPVSGTRNATGLTEYLVIYGTARITEGGAPELLQRLARRYLGPDVRFPPMDNPRLGTSRTSRWIESTAWAHGHSADSSADR